MARCALCSAAVPDSARFCASCGAPLDSSDAPTGTAPREVRTPARTPGTPRPGSPGAPSSRSGIDVGRFAPGELLLERYRIVGLLGRGGMGEVYRADDLKLGQAVALKFLPLDLAGSQERLERLYGEVRIARQVSHASVCRVYDVGEYDGGHFLSMEFVDGEDLASLLRRIGRLPEDKALEIARQLCAGLAAAHERGVLHRDLKPANVMIDGRGHVRVTDFGLASLIDSGSGDDVRSGTPAYMAPEQLAGREVTVRSDLYALGLVLYELFTGRRAFDGRSVVELFRQHQSETPRRPSEVVTELDPAVEHAILSCLEKDPARRPASAISVAAMMPGGDPLAAALAAGETPSPELVAAAGAQAGLSPAAAWGWLAFTLVGAVGFLLVSRGFYLSRVVPFEKPVEVLADRARGIIASLGPGDAPADSAFGLAFDADYYRYVLVGEGRSLSWERLSAGQPAVLRFWFRQSPRPLVSTGLGSRVYSQSPPPTVSGMAGVWLDTKGRLTEFYRVPPQVDASPAPAGGEAQPDWTPLFEAAQLDPAAFLAVPPAWSPPFFCDSRAAWEGVYPDRPDLKLRLEAAGYRGRPVWFQMIAPWARADRMEAFKPTSTQIASAWVGTLLLLGAFLASVLLARNNLRLGRGDRRGAARLSVGAVAVGMLAWLLDAGHVASLEGEAKPLLRGMGLALVCATFLGLLYLALEPQVRRLWPDTLISWTRLLTGRVRDPLVGAHVLTGLGYGVGAALILAGVRSLIHALAVSRPPSPHFLDTLLGVRETLVYVLVRVLESAGGGLAMLLLFAGLRSVVRREWLAAILVTLLVSLPDALSSSSPWIALPATVLLFAFLTRALVRQGLLTLIVAIFAIGLLVNMPQTPELGQWYATPTRVALAVLAVLALWAFRTCMAGRPTWTPLSGADRRGRALRD